MQQCISLILAVTVCWYLHKNSFLNVTTMMDASSMLIRDFPDHATFREKGAKLASADKLGVFLSLTLCKKAYFDPLQ